MAVPAPAVGAGKISKRKERRSEWRQKVSLVHDKLHAKSIPAAALHMNSLLQDLPVDQEEQHGMEASSSKSLGLASAANEAMHLTGQSKGLASSTVPIGSSSRSGPVAAASSSLFFNARPSSRRVKGRRALQVLEARQFEAVINHPAFKKDPTATLHTHLTNVAVSCLPPP